MVLNPAGTKKEAFKAGVAVAIGLVTLGIFIILLGGHTFWEKYDVYTVYFRSVKDLSAGRPVKYAGLTVGQVNLVKLDPSNPARVRVDIGVEQGFPLHEGTVAMITQKGLVGDNFVMLELVEDPGPKLKPGSVLPYREASSMTEVAQNMGRAVEELKPKLLSILDGLDKLVGSTDSKSLNAALVKLPDLMDNVNATLASIRTNLDTLTGSATSGIDRSSRSLTKTLDSVEKSVTTLQKDVSNTLSGVDKAVESAGAFTDDLSAGMDYNQEKIEVVLDNLEQLTEDLGRLTRSLEERPYRVLYKPERRSVE